MFLFAIVVKVRDIMSRESGALIQPQNGRAAIA